MLIYDYAIKKGENMATNILLVNQKGGVGKTTFADEIAWGLERRGHKVGFGNLDPQGGANHEKGLLDDTDAVNVIDTPGFLSDDTAEYAKNADIAIIPVQPGTLGLKPMKRTIKVITEDATAADLVESGTLQIAGIQSTDAKRLTDNKDLVYVPANGFNTNAVLFMHKDSSPMNDPKLREGVAMLLDSVAGGTAETQGMGIPRRTMYTPNVDCYNPDADAYAPKYDPKAAAAFLDKAGYKVGADGKRTKPDGSKLTIRVIGNNNQGKIPQFIADSLERGAIDADLFVGTYNESIAKLLTDQFDVGSYPFTDSTPTPAAWQSQIGSGASANFGQINNTEFDRLAQEALSVDPATDPEGRCAKWQAAEKAVLQAADLVPMDQPTNHWFGNGVTFNAAYFRIDPFSIRSK